MITRMPTLSASSILSVVVMVYRKYSNALMTAIAALILCRTAFAQGESPGSYISDNSFDAGSVRQGDLVEHVFMARNSGPSAVTVSIDGLSHPGMKVRMTPKLLPGETGRITVTWDTRLVQGDATAEASLRFNQAETILSLSAKVVPPIEILPYSAVFISGFRDEGVTRTLEIVNNDPAPLNVVGIARENESDRSYSATFRTIEAGRRHEVNIELKSGAPLGASRDVLIVHTDHSRFPVIRVPVNLLVKSDVYINPESVDFGQITGGAWNAETFLLKSRRGPIKVISATSDLPFLRVTETAPAAASTHEFTVEVEGKLPMEAFSGTIYIKTDDPLFPEIRAQVQGEVLRSP